MAAWRRLPPSARGWLIAAVSGLICSAATIVLTASGLVDSQIPSIGGPPTVTVTAIPTAGPLEPVAPAPKDRFGDSPGDRGFAVGSDVLAGRYVSKAPRDGESCTWQRLQGKPGELLRVADGRKLSGPSTMTVKIGDVVVTSGCEEWVRQP